VKVSSHNSFSNRKTKFGIKENKVGSFQRAWSMLPQVTHNVFFFQI